MIRAAFDAWNESLQGVRDINGLTWSLSFDPIPPSMYKSGKNSLGLGDRNGTLVVVLLTQAWTDPADNERVYAASAALIDALEEAARKLNAYDPFIYLPYAAKWQNPIPSYGKASVHNLQQLRARVDPTQVFTHLVPGGFKVPS